MNGLALHLLGTPQALQEGEPVTGFRSTKARALLFYVAAAAQPQSRTKLAGLLWGNLTEENANANLRKTLTNLRKVAGAHLAITRQTVALDEENPPWVDVREFDAALDVGDLERLQVAVDLYHGEFLEGFYVPKAPEFETWQLAERHRLRERLLAALQQLAQIEAGRGQFAVAIDHAQRLLALEPLREDAHRLLMVLLVQDGQRARALAQYEACAAILAREMGVEPDDETTALFEQIRTGTFSLPPAAARPHNLPASVTSFVGREAQLEHIVRWLARGPQRLLTITGLGGVGKTRLVQEAGWQALDNFTHGVWLVSLVSLQDPSDLARLVAATLNVSLVGKGDPREQLIRYLRRKRVLLILDNAEHLISPALSDFLMAILTQAPYVKIIVTSRQRLHMQAEQVMTLPGLAYPHKEAVGLAVQYPAAQLFLQRAEGHGQALPDTVQAAAALHDLCKLVDGLPLALELAATWTPTMPLAEIVSSIRRGLDLLATDLHDVPARHRSMQAVFDTSWRLLQEEERRIMRQLAYFRDGFSPQYAAEVVGASAAQLRALAGKSLIRRKSAPGGLVRYEMHELIRQHATEKMTQHPQEAQVLARRHGRTFAAFLADREEAIQGAGYLRAKEEIEAEAGNVRKAWEWAVTARSLQDVTRSVETLHYYFLNTQGLFDEAAQRFQRAAEEIAGDVRAEAQSLVGRLLLRAAINRRMLGQLEEASRLAEESLSIFYRHELDADITRATSTLGVIRLQQNDRDEALRLAKTAADQARELDEPADHCLCLNNLAFVLGRTGSVAEAATVAEESAALAREIGYPHGELSALNMLGVHYTWLGEEDEAQRIFEQLVARCREAGTQSRLAQAVNNLGSLYKARGQSEKALPLLQEAARLYEAVGQVHYAAFVGVMLGELALEQGHDERARSYYRRAIETAQDVDMPALALNAIMLLAQIVTTQGRDEEAVSMLALVANHEATLDQNRKEAQQALQSLQAVMDAQIFAAARDRGTAATLEDLLV